MGCPVIEVSNRVVVSPTDLVMETDPVSETLCFLVYFLGYRKMGKIQ
jgi:hypothetical protein